MTVLPGLFGAGQADESKRIPLPRSQAGVSMTGPAQCAVLGGPGAATSLPSRSLRPGQGRTKVFTAQAGAPLGLVSVLSSSLVHSSQITVNLQ